MYAFAILVHNDGQRLVEAADDLLFARRRLPGSTRARKSGRPQHPEGSSVRAGLPAQASDGGPPTPALGRLGRYAWRQHLARHDLAVDRTRRTARRLGLVP